MILIGGKDVWQMSCRTSKHLRSNKCEIMVLYCCFMNEKLLNWQIINYYNYIIIHIY